MFVEHTRGGEMAKRLRLQLGRIENLMGFKLKIVEKTGTKLKDLFSPTNIWKGSQCGRDGCTTCNQGGEDLPDCKMRSIVYESICTKCNPGAKAAGPLKSPETSVPSIYVGESSRSIFERAGEHWKSYEKRNTDSHIWKHHLIHHGGEGEPEMRFKIVGNYRTALSRQIAEAIRIRKRGTSVLNSKGEYDRCRIHRLTIGKEESSHGGTTTEIEGNTTEDVAGEQYLMGKRRTMDRRNVPEIVPSKSRKRGNTSNEEGTRTGRPNKKRKFVLIGEAWGKGGKDDQGLNRELGTGPLTSENEGNTTKMSDRIQQEENLDEKQGTSPLQDRILEQVQLEEDPKYEGGTGPLSRSIESSSEVERGDSRRGQLSMRQFVTEEKRGNTSTNIVRDEGVPPDIENLYDTAHNLSMIRDMRGDCIVRNKYCQEHGQIAKKVTHKKEVWTRNRKTGLYGYRNRKVSVWRCNRNMGTLVCTMGSGDGDV